MPAADLSTVEQHLRWYLGRKEIGKDASRVMAGGSLALIGDKWDDLEGFADRLAPERPVLDLTKQAPSARALRHLFGSNPETIILSRRAELVITTLGDLSQPWYLFVSPLSARPDDAMPLLHEAIAQLGVRRTLDVFGAEFVSSLAAYKWPRGLCELRAASWRLGALLDRRNNMSGAARLLDVSPQAMAKYINRRRSGRRPT